MPTKDNGRTQGQPLCVRMNPAERASSAAKAALVRIRESELVRRLLDAFDPANPPWEPSRQTFHGTRQTSSGDAVPGDLTVHYDPVEPAP